MKTGLRYTGEDLLRLPKSERYELVRGELVEMPPPPGGRHGLVAGGVYNLVDRHGRGLGWTVVESGFYISRDPDTVRAPDVSFYSRHRVAEVPEGYFEVCPDLAVEVVSPSQTSSDLEERVQEFLAAGVRQVWVLYPRTRTVHRYYPGGKAQVLYAHDELDGEDVLPGFHCPVNQLFEA